MAAVVTNSAILQAKKRLSGFTLIELLVVLADCVSALAA
jgi:type II secretory pathway pseudopilin PulG